MERRQAKGSHGDSCPTLEEYGISKDVFFQSIPKMAQDAMTSGSPQNTLREVTRQDVEQMYKNLW